MDVPPEAAIDVAAFLVSQLMIFTWIGTRLWQRASEAIWYRNYQRIRSPNRPGLRYPLPCSHLSLPTRNLERLRVAARAFVLSPAPAHNGGSHAHPAARGHQCSSSGGNPGSRISAPCDAIQGQSAPLKTPGNFLDVQGSKIYYQECGTGPDAVVLIHDGIADSLVWDGVWPAFCRQFHTIRYDRRGYGRSPATFRDLHGNRRSVRALASSAD